MKNLKVDVIGCDIENYLVITLPFYLIPKSGKLPFLNQSFDFAMLNDVLYHVDESNQRHGSLKTPLTFRTSDGWRKVFEKMKLEYSIEIVKTPMWYPFLHIAMMIKRRED